MFSRALPSHPTPQEYLRDMMDCVRSPEFQSQHESRAVAARRQWDLSINGDEIFVDHKLASFAQNMRWLQKQMRLGTSRL